LRFFKINSFIIQKKQEIIVKRGVFGIIIENNKKAGNTFGIVIIQENPLLISFRRGSIQPLKGAIANFKNLKRKTKKLQKKYKKIHKRIEKASWKRTYFKYPEEDSSSKFKNGKGIILKVIKIKLAQIKQIEKSEKQKSITLIIQRLKEIQKLYNIKIKNREISFHTISLLKK